MAYLITHSLLSSWLYSLKENPFDDATQVDTSKEDFLKVLRREPTETTEAMQKGIDFENLVTSICEGEETVQCVIEDAELKASVPVAEDIKKHPWYPAALTVATIVKGGQLQYVAKKRLEIGGMELLLYGRLDALKAGKIFDIKFSGSYDRGKYFGSTQHPMYLELMPEVGSFTYLVSNGTDVWTERYRRDETQSIIPVIRYFLDFMNMCGYMDLYKQYWGEKPEGT